MKLQSYDIAVIGNTLSARMNATLLAKNGLRVIRLDPDTPTETGWLFSSIFLEKLLGTLGGRSCFTSQAPIQVISPNSRVSIHQETSLRSELQREFGIASGSVESFLDRLLHIGENLTALLWDIGGLPFSGFKSRSLFRYHCLRHKTSVKNLNQALTDPLQQFNPNARAFLTHLFEGLSLQPVRLLSLADAALLWVQANRPENLGLDSFYSLLNKRFEQFHGETVPLDQVERIDLRGRTFFGGHVKERGSFQADTLLVGDLKSAARYESLRDLLPVIDNEVVQWDTGDVSGQLSPLLSERVIIGDTHPLRIAFIEQDRQVRGVVDAPGAITVDRIMSGLDPVLPFAAYELTPLSTPHVPEKSAGAQAGPRSFLSKPVQFGRNMYCADSRLLSPGMPAAGGALLAWTLYARLGKPQAGAKSQG